MGFRQGCYKNAIDCGRRRKSGRPTEMSRREAEEEPAQLGSARRVAIEALGKGHEASAIRNSRRLDG